MGDVFDHSENKHLSRNLEARFTSFIESSGGILTSWKYSLFANSIDLTFQMLLQMSNFFLPTATFECARFLPHKQVGHATLPPKTNQIHTSTKVALAKPQTARKVETSWSFST